MAKNIINIQCRGADSLPIDVIEEFQGNLKKRGKKEIDAIITSIEKYGFSFPFFIWNGDGHNKCLDGHGRIQALCEMRQHRDYDLPLFPVAYIEAKDEAEAKQKLLRLNSQYGQMSIDSVLEFTDGLEVEWDELALPGGELLSIGDSEPEESKQEPGCLSDAFLVPPFSIFDTRQGYWGDRKRWWSDQIGDNGETRENTLATSVLDYSFWGGRNGNPTDNSIAPMQSILDPVLAEICCKWFALPDCNMFDCFAGDSVFGYVASALGHRFIGIELRQEQADKNAERIKDFTQSKYICDDGQNVLEHIDFNSQDFLFSCPPYFDLEVYSELKNDASNQGSYEDFLKIIESAFSSAIKCLKDDRFAVITVGDIRNKKTGGYYGFPDDIKTIFKRNGMMIYNEIILIERAGTAALRASRVMEHRKVVKTHQNVMVFYKGNQKNIKNIFPKIDVMEVPDESADV